MVSLFASTDVGATQSLSANRPAAHRAARHASVSAKGYATSLFARIPLPPTATPIATPTKPLQPVTGSPSLSHVEDVTRYYLLPSSSGVGGYARSHFPSDEWQGTGSTSDGGYRVSYSFSGLALCSDRHAAYCGVTYTTAALPGGRQELRVDVAVVWLAVHVVYLPTTGVVTLTGFEKISLMNPSSGPVVVTLSAKQVKRLRVAIARLRPSPGGICMEDSALYKIVVANKGGGEVFWSASADECPGALMVSSRGSHVALNGRSCQLEGLVSSFFPGKEAQGTKAGLKVCQRSL